MARDLYPGQFVQLEGGSAAPAPNLPFTVWTDLFGGVDVTSQIVGPDGVSAYDAVTDAQGNLLPFRGPDGYQGNLFVDTGVSMRFLLLSSTLIDWLVAQIGSLVTQIANLPAGGGGLPAGTTLEDIPNGVSRLAMTTLERQTIAGLPVSYLKVGSAHTDAKAGDYNPTAKDVGGVTAMGMVGPRIWFGRTTTQGPPTAAEGAVVVTDYAFLDVG